MPAAVIGKCRDAAGNLAGITNLVLEVLMLMFALGNEGEYVLLVAHVLSIGYGFAYWFVGLVDFLLVWHFLAFKDGFEVWLQLLGIIPEA